MKQFACVAALFMALVAVQAQVGHPQVVPGGEYAVADNDVNVDRAKHDIIQEMENHAKTLEGSPSVELSDFDVKKQVVAGIRYNFTFKAVYTSHNGEKTTKSCNASLLKPLSSDDPSGTIKFIKNAQNENIHCV